jgi:hypothetical protein
MLKAFKLAGKAQAKPARMATMMRYLTLIARKITIIL